MAKRAKTENPTTDISNPSPQLPDSPTERRDPNPAASAEQEVAGTPREERFAEPQHPISATSREQQTLADPRPYHSVQWPDDGYRITLQESHSRNTIEIQFGDGSRSAQPKAFAEIKQRLKDEGFNWNGTNAWAKELVPVLGSQNDRLRAREENHRIRARVEDVMFPAVIALEEAVRGEIPLTEESRQRITKGASAGRG
jgi:hypothetical protein